MKAGSHAPKLFLKNQWEAGRARVWRGAGTECPIELKSWRARSRRRLEMDGCGGWSESRTRCDSDPKGRKPDSFGDMCSGAWEFWWENKLVQLGPLDRIPVPGIRSILPPAGFSQATSYATLNSNSIVTPARPNRANARLRPALPNDFYKISLGRCEHNAIHHFLTPGQDHHVVNQADKLRLARTLIQPPHRHTSELRTILHQLPFTVGPTLRIAHVVTYPLGLCK